MTGISRCGSCSANPRPGKCFATAAIPAPSIPLIIAVPKEATISGSSPNALTPMIGLFLLVFTSSTGAKIMFTPSARSSHAAQRPTRSANSTRPVAAIAIADGKRVAPRGMR